MDYVDWRDCVEELCDRAKKLKEKGKLENGDIQEVESILDELEKLLV